MWEPALYAGFQAPGKDRELPFWERHGGVPALHFHSEAKDFAHFRQNQPQATAQDLKLRFVESRVSRVLLQILVQSPKNVRTVHAWLSSD